MTLETLSTNRSHGGTQGVYRHASDTTGTDMSFAVSFNLATYRGQQGFSGAAVAKVGQRAWFSGGIAGSTVKGSTGGRVGVTFGW